MIDKEAMGIRSVNSTKKTGRTILIYGDAGRGKTTLLDTLNDRTLLINVDCGEQVLSSECIDVYDLVSGVKDDPSSQIERFEKMADWMLAQSTLPWEYVVIDNISELQDAYNEAMQQRRRVKYPAQVDYRNTGIEMKRWLRKLRNLTYKGVNVIYIAWEDNTKIEDFGGAIESRMLPMIMGKSCKSITGLVDFVMCMRVDKKQHRYLQLDGDVRYLAKKREEAGREYPSIIWCPKKEKDTLQKFFSMIKEGANEAD